MNFIQNRIFGSYFKILWISHLSKFRFYGTAVRETICFQALDCTGSPVDIADLRDGLTKKDCSFLFCPNEGEGVSAGPKIFGTFS